MLEFKNKLSELDMGSSPTTSFLHMAQIPGVLNIPYISNLEATEFASKCSISSKNFQ